MTLRGNEVKLLQVGKRLGQDVLGSNDTKLGITGLVMAHTSFQGEASTAQNKIMTLNLDLS